METELKTRLSSIEGKRFSFLSDSGVGKERTWKRFAWKVLGYSTVAAIGLIALSSL